MNYHLNQAINHYYTMDTFLQLMRKQMGEILKPESQHYQYHFLKLNHSRILRINNHHKLHSNAILSVQELKQNQTWLLLTDTWCGDSAQSLPYINKFVEAANGKIVLKILIRDEHLNLMDLHLTHNSRSIPKLIAVSAQDEVLFTWGPRPLGATEIFQYWKENQHCDWESFETQLHQWYKNDNGITIQNEIAQLISES